MHVFRTLLAAAVASGFSAQLAAETIAVRVQNTTLQPDGSSYEPAISADGKYIAFGSDADNLVGDDNDNEGELFKYDKVADTITSLTGPNDGNVFETAISAQGRFVVYSTDGNLSIRGGPRFTICTETFNGHDVVWVDTQENVYKLVSAAAGCDPVADPATDRANGTSDQPVVSADGNYVAFYSTASNLISPAVSTLGRGHIFERNMATGEIRLVTANPVTGAEGSESSSGLEPSAMSSDGSRLVIETPALNLAPDNTVNGGNVSDVLLQTIDRVHDTVTFENMNRNPQTGAVGDRSSENGSISPNGKFVIFLSGATNLLPGGRSPSDQIVRDVEARTLRAVPLPPGMSRCLRGRVTNRGDAIVHCTPAVGSGATVAQLFRVTAEGAFTLLSRSPDGGYADRTAGVEFTASADGRMVATQTDARNLLPAPNTDTNDFADIYMLAEPEVFEELFRDGFE